LKIGSNGLFGKNIVIRTQNRGARFERQTGLKTKKIMKLPDFLVTLFDISKTSCSKDDSNQPVTDKFDPLFAQELQKRGYIADASCIMPEDVKNITELDVSDGELTSLRGIEYFESLTKLYCPCNRLTSLDVRKNTALTVLVCFCNYLTSLNVSKNTALKELMCDNNRLTLLDVSKNTALTKLVCYENQLTSLDMSNCTVLTTLWCDGNELTSLDVRKNTMLTSLGCFANQLTSLDVRKNTALTYLSCPGNPGDGAVFPVKAWFDNNSIPNSEDFTTGSWDYDGKTVRIDYRKAK